MTRLHGCSKSKTRRARVREQPALWEGGGCELTSMYRWPRPKRSQQPLGVVQNWSALQCSPEKTLNYVVMTMRL